MKKRVTLSVEDLMVLAKQHPNMFSKKVVKSVTKSKVKLSKEQVQVLNVKCILLDYESKGSFRLASELPSLLQKNEATENQVKAVEIAFAKSFNLTINVNEEW